jgi:hypothetical protein
VVSAKCTSPASACRPPPAPPRAGVVGKGVARPLRPDEAADQRQQIADLGAAAPEGPVRRPALLEHIHEQGRLPRLDGVRGTHQRHAHVGPQVGEQAPEQAVGHRIEALHAEQLLGRSRSSPNKPFCRNSTRQPARLGEGRQQQGVQPHREADDKPARAPARVPPRQYMPPSIAGANWPPRQS